MEASSRRSCKLSTVWYYQLNTSQLDTYFSRNVKTLIRNRRKERKKETHVSSSILERRTIFQDLFKSKLMLKWDLPETLRLNERMHLKMNKHVVAKSVEAFILLNIHTDLPMNN